jgi:uncharacterized protein
MEKEFAPTRLDVKALAQSGLEISGHDLLSRYERLAQDLQGQGPDLALNWSARGESRLGPDGKPAHWLHLALDTALPLICQRCLGPVNVPVNVKRSFRFVATEEEAQAQDDEVDEDLLVLSREFNLAELIEDELVMDLPLIPRHDVCPTSVKLAAADADFDASVADKPNPFASLSELVIGKPTKP